MKMSVVFFGLPIGWIILFVALIAMGGLTSISDYVTEHLAFIITIAVILFVLWSLISALLVKKRIIFEDSELPLPAQVIIAIITMAQFFVFIGVDLYLISEYAKSYHPFGEIIHMALFVFIAFLDFIALANAYLSNDSGVTPAIIVGIIGWILDIGLLSNGLIT